MQTMQTKSSAPKLNPLPPAAFFPQMHTQLADDVIEAARLADGIRETMLLLTSEQQVTDHRRWKMFLQFLRATDHELGRAVETERVHSLPSADFSMRAKCRADIVDPTRAVGADGWPLTD